MSVYAESSAVLAWLLDEDSAPEIRKLLAAQDLIVASDLTLIECDRVLLRAASLGELTEAEAADRRGHLTETSSHWQILRISPEVVDRARRPSRATRFARSMRFISHPRLWLMRRCQDCSSSRSMTSGVTPPRRWALKSCRPNPHLPAYASAASFSWSAAGMRRM